MIHRGTNSFDPKRERSRGRCAAAAGLTLIELLMALAGTALVALAIVAMLFAVSRGADGRTDLRSTVVRQKALIGRITAAIRSSHRVLAADDDAIVLWMADSDGDGNPNLGELRRIERNVATKEVSSYTAPFNLSPASNTSYPLASTNFESTTAALQGTDDFPQELWATEVGGWTLALNHAVTQQASLVSFRVTLEAGGLEQTAIAAAALRNR